MKRHPGDLLLHPEVVGATAKVLRGGGVQAQELSDAVGDVQLRVLHSLRNRPTFLWPREVGEWKGLCIQSARTWLYDRNDKAKSARKAGDVGLMAGDDAGGGAESHAPDVRDDLELVEQAVKSSAKPELDREVVRGMYEEEPQAIIAQRLGITEEVVRNRVRVIRQRFYALWSAVVVGATAIVLVFAMRRPDDGGGFASIEHPRPLPSLVELASFIREDAKKACGETDHFDRCIEELDQAKLLDPAGDQDPRIQQVRQHVKDVQQERQDEQNPIDNAKPGSPLFPQPKPAPTGSGAKPKGGTGKQ
ncbi:MAG TPA: hypothetical protein VIF09_20100 [Polyangiaceae bacterium]